MTPPVQFTCEYCHQPVPWMDAGLYRYEHRNQCPHCLWSKHIMFGTGRLPPCDGLMRPVMTPLTDPRLLPQLCVACGFRWIIYEEDQWAILPPDQQTALINAAWTETEQQNDAPTVIYRVKPLYVTQPPRIPVSLLGTRTRVKRRP